jgi:hypothetical protein
MNSSQKQVFVSNQAPKSAIDELQQLANLKEKGLLTDDEFAKKKREILNGT